MIVLLLADSGLSNEQLESDIKSIRKGVNYCQEKIDKGQKIPPMIMALKGYSAFAIPGTIEEVESVQVDGGDSIIKLDIQYLFEMTQEGGM